MFSGLDKILFFICWVYFRCCFSLQLRDVCTGLSSTLQRHPACIHLQGLSNQQILWNIIMLNMEACGSGNLQEHIPLPYLDARLVLIVLWGCEIAKVAQLYILPCLSFVLPHLFLFLHLYPVTQIMLSSLFPQRRGRNHTLSFEHERQDRKTTTRTTDHCMCLSVFVCFCMRMYGFYSQRNLSSYMCMYAYLRCHVDALECVCGGLGFHALLLCWLVFFLLLLRIYLCGSACLRACRYRSFHVSLRRKPF